MTNQTTLGYRVNCTLISIVSAAVNRLNLLRPSRGLDCAGPGYRQVADACACGDESLGSVKFGEFLD